MCAYIVNEEYYSKNGGAPAEERAELQRIQQEGVAKKLDVGMVRAWVLTPDGHPYDMLDGAKVGPTLAGLQRAVEHFKPRPGQPVVPPGPQRGVNSLRRTGSYCPGRTGRNSCQRATSARASGGSSTGASALKS